MNNFNINNKLSWIDFLTILSTGIGIFALVLGIRNLEENRIQSKDSEKILHQLEVHLKNQDKHLEFQDKLLGKED